MLAEVRMGADFVKMMEGARKGRSMGEGAEGTGGEGGGDDVWAVWVVGKSFVMMLFVVFVGELKETSVAESPKVVEELDAGRVT